MLRGAHSFASALIDDVYSETFERHIEDVKEVLRWLADAGITANVSKCRFVLPKLKALGRVIEDGQIKICDDKVDAIMKLNERRTKRQVNMILGTFGYHRAHIREFSTIAQPLVDLLKKDQPDRVIWGPAQQSAFDDLKRWIVAKQCLPARPLPWLHNSNRRFGNSNIGCTHAANRWRREVYRIRFKAVDTGPDAVVNYLARALRNYIRDKKNGNSIFTGSRSGSKVITDL